MGKVDLPRIHANHARPQDISNPESYEHFVELVIPVLQERSIMWKDYAVPGGTCRENLLGKPGVKLAPSTQSAPKFRYDVLKEKYGDENGDIQIDRKTEEVLGEKVNGVNLNGRSH